MYTECKRTPDWHLLKITARTRICVRVFGRGMKLVFCFYYDILPAINAALPTSQLLSQWDNFTGKGKCYILKESVLMACIKGNVRERKYRNSEFIMKLT